MLPRTVLALALMAPILTSFACGALDATIDASVDAALEAHTICASGQFGVPTALDALNTDVDERGLRLTSDETTGIFSRGATNAPALVYAAGRANAFSSFGAAMVITNENQNSGFTSVYPTIANGGTTLFVESTCTSENGNANSPVCRLDSDSGLDGYLHTPWQPVLIDTPINVGPFGAGFSVGDGYATEDGLVYYFVAAVETDGATAHHGVYESRFEKPWTSSELGTRSIVLSDTTSDIDTPVASGDELVLFVSVTTATQPVAHIAFAMRASRDVVFGPLTPLHELDSAEGEYPSWISPDMCRLYMTRRVNGQTDLFVASRSN